MLRPSNEAHESLPVHSTCFLKTTKKMEDPWGGQRPEQVALKAIVTVSLLCCGKTPDHGELREGGFILASSLRVQSLTREGMRTRGAWWQAYAAETLVPHNLEEQEAERARPADRALRLAYHDPLSPAPSREGSTAQTMP